MSKLEALAIAKACYERLYSYSRYNNKTREPLAAPGSHQGGSYFLLEKKPGSNSVML